MSKTQENLKEAFAGESQAFQKYSAFADKAEKDGMPNIARLFRTTAQAERIRVLERKLAVLTGTEEERLNSPERKERLPFPRFQEFEIVAASVFPFPKCTELRTCH